MLVTIFRAWILGCLLILGMGLVAKGKFIVGGGIARGIALEATQAYFGRSYTLIGFVTNKGEYVERQLQTNKRISKGEHIPIIYKHKNPERAHIFRAGEFWFDGIIVGVILFVFWTGLVLVKYHHSRT